MNSHDPTGTLLESKATISTIERKGKHCESKSGSGEADEAPLRGSKGEEYDAETVTDSIVRKRRAKGFISSDDIRQVAGAIVAPASPGAEGDKKTSALIDEISVVSDAAVAPSPSQAKAGVDKERGRTEDGYDGDESTLTLSNQNGKKNDRCTKILLLRAEDRKMYAMLSGEERRRHNAKLRKRYHRQKDLVSRLRHREMRRQRQRHSALPREEVQERNARRARLERERYQRLPPALLEARRRRSAALGKRHTPSVVSDSPESQAKKRSQRTRSAENRARSSDDTEAATSPQEESITERMECADADSQVMHS